MKTFTNFTLLDEVNSTNNYLADMLQKQPDLPELHGVFTRCQTSGRGQRGNSWYSTPGQNVTFSILLRPQFLEVDEQFAVSELAAICVARAIAYFLSEEQREILTIKWPNDIFYGEKKIAGILIEHSITGNIIDYSIVGMGININENNFPSDLPNPIALKDIIGREVVLKEFMEVLLQEFQDQYRYIKKGRKVELHERFLKHMYRNDGQFHLFHDAYQSFEARIKGVEPNGCLVLEKRDGTEQTFAFKEIVFDGH